MTHIYAYIKDGCSPPQLRQLIGGIKTAAGEGFHISAHESTVVVKELPEECRDENFGALALVYIAKGRGLDVKQKFAKLLDDAFRTALGETGKVKLVIKEQADDMAGLGGVLRYDAAADTAGAETTDKSIVD